MKVLNRVIEIPIFNKQLDLYIGEMADCSVCFDKTYSLSESTDAFGAEAFSTSLTSVSDGWAIYAMFVKKDIETADIYHESLHITRWILDQVGVITNVDNHEAECYLQTFIAKEVISVLEKINKPKKKKKNGSKKASNTGRKNK